MSFHILSFILASEKEETIETIFLFLTLYTKIDVYSQKLIFIYITDKKLLWYAFPKKSFVFSTESFKKAVQLFLASLFNSLFCINIEWKFNFKYTGKIAYHSAARFITPSFAPWECNRLDSKIVNINVESIVVIV